ncbi:MAG: hypothetical protein I3273_04660 [Candidatus Moeniiplasma glomeromycotorum]|nr:hypothetical protein [Candidatus Moeniiplasma glomeromycotorum]MCE8169385.1 hypothetical protein [Candidatus Moeniiplasma glomeromycotorum]
MKNILPPQTNFQNQKEKKWYNPADYLGAWMTVAFLSLLLAIIIFVLIRKAKKKKKK